MRWTLAILWLVVLCAACASPKPAGSGSDTTAVTLTVSEYVPGDRNPLVEIENKSKRDVLSYDGPFVEYLTNGNWTEYTSDVPEMQNVKQRRRLGPTQSGAWHVRIPPGSSSWRTYIHARLFPLKGPEPANPHEFTVWSKEMAR